METIRKLFEGEPRTKETRDEHDQPVFHIRAKALTPLRAKIADAIAFLTGVWFVFVAVNLLIANDGSLLHWLIALPAAFFIGCYAGTDASSWVQQRRNFRIDARHFAVRQGWQWICFDRNLPHRFALVPHPKAEDEKLRHEYARQKAAIGRRAVMPHPYYGRSYIIVLEQLGERHPLMSVYDREVALTIVNRLQAVNEVIESRLKKNRSAALSPADQWGQQAGDLPANIISFDAWRTDRQTIEE